MALAIKFGGLHVLHLHCVEDMTFLNTELIHLPSTGI